MAKHSPTHQLCIKLKPKRVFRVYKLTIKNCTITDFHVVPLTSMQRSVV